MTRFVLNDGGRKAAGFKGQARDCVCRSVAIATGKPYSQVWGELSAIGWTENLNKYPRDVDGLVIPRSWAREREYIESLGWRWHPTMKIGSGCKVHLCPGELPTGRLIVRVSKHLTAVIDGVIHDTFDPSRGGTRCVYGYFAVATWAAIIGGFVS